MFSCALINGTLYLSHHGILGQKWGIRRYQNPDGTLTAAGRKRYAKAWKEDHHLSSYGEHPGDFYEKREKLSGEPFRKIQSKLSKHIEDISMVDREAKEVFGEIMEDGPIRDKYASIAAIANGLLYDNSEKQRMENIGIDMWFYAREDGDQGEINSVSVWARDNKKLDKASELSEKFRKAEEEYSRECKKLVDTMIGEYSNYAMTPMGGWTVGKSIVNSMKYSDTKGMYDVYMPEMALDWRNPSEAELAAVKRAKAIVSKIDYGHGKASNVMAAIKNAGLNDIELKDMTDKQWEQLNTELLALGKR